MASFGRFVSRTVGLTLAVSAATVAGAAILALGGRVSPRLDVVAHFAPLYAFAALAVAASAMLLPVALKRTALALSAVAIMASGALIVPEYLRPAGPTASPDAPGQIKVIQINALRRNTDIRRVADWLIAQDPDVVTLGEARSDLRALLLQQTGWKTAGAHGNLIIFTRERYLRMDRPRLPPRSHLTFVNATYAHPGAPFEIVTIHFAHPTHPVIGEQIAHLERVVAARPQARMVLTGDFNATPWSQEMRRLDASLGLIRRDRAVATWPAQVLGRPWPLPFLPIDHVYAGREWATVKVERGPWLGSDHYPLIVTLAPIPPR